MSNETAFRALVSAMSELSGTDERVTIEMGNTQYSLEMVADESVNTDGEEVETDVLLNMFVAAMSEGSVFDEPVTFSVGGHRVRYMVGEETSIVVNEDVEEVEDVDADESETDEVDADESDVEQPDNSPVTTLPPQEDVDSAETVLKQDTKLYNVLVGVASIERAWVTPAEVADVIDDMPSRVSATMSDLYREKGLLERKPLNEDNDHNAKTYRINKDGVAELKRHE